MFVPVLWKSVAMIHLMFHAVHVVLAGRLIQITLGVNVLVRYFLLN